MPHRVACADSIPARSAWERRPGDDSRSNARPSAKSSLFQARGIAGPAGARQEGSLARSLTKPASVHLSANRSIETSRWFSGFGNRADLLISDESEK